MSEEITERLLRELKGLEAEREALERKRIAIENQILGLRRALDLLTRGAAAEPVEEEREAGVDAAPRRERSRKPIRDIVLRILEAGPEGGMNARMVVEAADRQGIELDKNSVSSLLSRLKRDGMVTFDGHFYRPVRAAGPASAVLPSP